MSIGHSPEQAQWTPDMRKNIVDITEAEKREAKRRIQGNVALQESPDGSSEDGNGPLRRNAAKPTLNTMAASAM